MGRIPEYVVRGGQGRAGTDVSVTGRQTFWVTAVCVVALAIMTSSPPQQSPRPRQGNETPRALPPLTLMRPSQHIPTTQHGAGASFYDQPAEAVGD